MILLCWCIRDALERKQLLHKVGKSCYSSGDGFGCISKGKNSFNPEANKSFCGIYEYLRQTSSQCALKRFFVELIPEIWISRWELRGESGKVCSENARSTIHNFSAFAFSPRQRHKNADEKKTSICVLPLLLHQRNEDETKVSPLIKNKFQREKVFYSPPLLDFQRSDQRWQMLRKFASPSSASRPISFSIPAPPIGKVQILFHFV